MRHVWKDIRLGLRLLARERGFTAAAILTLALGIGANTAVFAVVHRVLLADLPYADAGRVLVISQRAPESGFLHLGVSEGELEALRTRTPAASSTPART